MCSVSLALKVEGSWIAKKVRLQIHAACNAKIMITRVKNGAMHLGKFFGQKFNCCDQVISSIISDSLWFVGPMGDSQRVVLLWQSWQKERYTCMRVRQITIVTAMQIKTAV